MNIQQDQIVRVQNQPALGTGQVIRVLSENGEQKAYIAFEKNGQQILMTFPVSMLELTESIFEKYNAGKSSKSINFALKQLAYQFPLDNLGGALSNSRTDLLPHQILLTHDVIKAQRRKFLIADEVGLGKTIETGMIIRELAFRGEGNRILVICPAGLTENWQRELRDCFRMNFERLGFDFRDSNSTAWENHNRVIVSIDTIKQLNRMERLLAGPKWDCIIFDEAHHLTRRRYGKKIDRTQNYRLAEKLKDHTRDLLFLSATPHQGDAYQFWSLVQLLDDHLFEDPDAMQDHRGLLGRVMFRRTKREVTDADGKPIFMRRDVHTQLFQLSLREQRFYEKLTSYLKEGYSAAGLDENETTSQQRAVGFVMATFQKIMSSSPRAIKQALRRRLLALFARKQMGLESGHVGRITNTAIAVKIASLQEQMRKLAGDILHYEQGKITINEADAYILRVKQRLAKRPKFTEEITQWALDAAEDSNSVIEAEANIPDEERKLQELVELVDEGPDRKLDTLLRAIEQLRRENPKEKMIIFTQYRETLFFLKDELGKYYGESNISVIKGGPLEDKIAACESFWKEDGTQFLISTTAGGEGINLQVCRILFNYDMPWNPMAVEQRIGRIHRYGQTETAQVYSLVAEDTIEEKVYEILERKLWEIANTIGKLDPQTQQVSEDFRTEVLGYLSSAVNYNDLYRTALVKKDYDRTEQEIEDALKQAKDASEALRQLAQDLTAFNLQNYIKIQGKYTLDNLRLFTEKSIMQLGGSFIPSGDFAKIIVPQVLMNYPNVSAKYENVTFVRKIATRKKGVEFLGLGHPLIDALVSYYKSESTDGDVLVCTDNKKQLLLNYIFEINFADGSKREIFQQITLEGEKALSELSILDSDFKNSTGQKGFEINFARLESVVEGIKASLRSDYDDVINIRPKCVGIFASI